MFVTYLHEKNPFTDDQYQIKYVPCSECWAHNAKTIGRNSGIIHSELTLIYTARKLFINPVLRSGLVWC